MKNRKDVINSVLKLMRAMKRRPGGNPDFTPAVVRLITVLNEKDGVQQRDLCDELDIRPSSMSELLVKAEEKGLIERSGNEEDKRSTLITLSGKGREAAEKIKSDLEADIARFTSCFTDEEAAQFCQLCEKLSAHLLIINKDVPEGVPPFIRPHHKNHGPGFEGPGKSHGFDTDGQEHSKPHGKIIRYC